MKITFVRNDNVAVALTPEFYDKIKPGSTFTADIKIVRCPGLHRKYFKMLRVVLHNLPERFGCKTIDALREELMFRAGYFKKFVLSTGEEAYKVESISFENMDQIQFEEVYNHCFDEACKMLGVKTFELGNEIEEFS